MRANRILGYTCGVFRRRTESNFTDVPMKTLSRFLALGLVVVTCVRANTVLLTDSFSGTSLDTSLWTTRNPYGDSSVVQSGGTVTSNNRGHVISTGSFYGALEINFSMSLSGQNSFGSIAWKTDGISFGSFDWPANGITLTFDNEKNWVNLWVNGIENAYDFSYPMPLSACAKINSHFRLEGECSSNQGAQRVDKG